MIIFTGNYNFFNLMTVVMSISLLDDNYIRGCLGKPKFGKFKLATIRRFSDSPHSAASASL